MVFDVIQRRAQVRQPKVFLFSNPLCKSIVQLRQEVKTIDLASKK
jgi:ABC-type sugar transport system ATPase subunit